MNTKKIAMLSLVLSVVVSAILSAQQLQPITLPAPQTDGGQPLMQALRQRHSARQFDERELPRQVLSNLLWAAFGVNRPGSGRRTAPSARNWQQIDVYVALAEGLFLYDAGENTLKPILGEDIREMTGRQAFTQQAPVNLIYVADVSRMRGAKPEDQAFYSATDTGFISQNVYLFCASEGLSTVVLGMVSKEELSDKMQLGPEQRIILTQPVGYPPK